MSTCSERDDLVDLRRGLVVPIVIIWVLTSIVLLMTGITLNLPEMIPQLIGGLVVMCLGSVLRIRHPRVSLVMTIVSFCALFTAGAAIASHAGLAFGTPMIDESIRFLQHPLGINELEITRAALTNRFVRGILFVTYSITMPMLLYFSIIVAIWRPVQATPVLISLGHCFNVAVIFSIFFPAAGFLTDLDPAFRDNYQVTGDYYLASQTALHSGSVTELSAEILSGVITMPSLHAVMALLLMQMLRIAGFPRFGVALAALTMISAVPFGGHYVLDVVGGFVLWAIVTKVVERERRAEEPRVFATSRLLSAVPVITFRRSRA